MTKSDRLDWDTFLLIETAQLGAVEIVIASPMASALKFET